MSPNLNMSSNLRLRAKHALTIRRPLLKQALGEFVGTFIMVLLGDGCIAQGVLAHDVVHHDHGGFVLVSLGWGFAVMMGVFFSMRTGRGIINPAVATAFWTLGRIGAIQLLIFSIAELFGAFFGAAVVYTVYEERIFRYARSLNLTGDKLLTINTTGGLFTTWPTISNGGAFYDQIVGTALLCGGALAIIDSANVGVPIWAHPPLIGLLVSAIVGAFALNAGAPLNPARDLGPRIFIAIAGWGPAAFTDHNYYFWVPIFGPLFGAILGALFYQLFVGLHIDKGDFEEEMQLIPDEEDQNLVLPISH